MIYCFCRFREYFQGQDKLTITKRPGFLLGDSPSLEYLHFIRK